MSVNLNGVIKWEGVFSNAFHIKSGVRQGGVWFRWIFNLFTDELIDMLEVKSRGCVFKDLFAGSICFADDIMLLSESIYKLQQMLLICSEFGLQFSFSFTPCI